MRLPDFVLAFGFPPLDDVIAWLFVVVLVGLVGALAALCFDADFPALFWRVIDRALPLPTVPSSPPPSPAPAVRDVLRLQVRALSLVRPAGVRPDPAAAARHDAAAAPASSAVGTDLAASLDVEAIARHLHAAALRRVGIPPSTSADESFDRLSVRTRAAYRAKAELAVRSCDPAAHGRGLSAAAVITPAFERAQQSYERAVLTAPIGGAQ